MVVTFMVMAFIVMAFVVMAFVVMSGMIMRPGRWPTGPGLRLDDAVAQPRHLLTETAVGSRLQVEG